LVIVVAFSLPLFIFTRIFHPAGAEKSMIEVK
jgi:hypothetical protein